jgi:hypothetical protein
VYAFKMIISCLCRESNYDSSVFHAVAYCLIRPDSMKGEHTTLFKKNLVGHDTKFLCGLYQELEGFVFRFPGEARDFSLLRKSTDWL